MIRFFHCPAHEHDNVVLCPAARRDKTEIHTAFGLNDITRFADPLLLHVHDAIARRKCEHLPTAVGACCKVSKLSPNRKEVFHV